MAAGPTSSSGSIAVLTGDLIGSRALSVAEVAHVREALIAAAGVAVGWGKELVIAGPQFFRGDSWQLALGSPSSFLRLAIGLRAALRAADERFDTRVDIAVGTADHLDREAVSLSIGEAFVRSGQALDALRGKGFGFSMGGEMPDRLALLAPLLSFCADAVGRLHQAQALAVWLSLDPSRPTHETVARLRGVTRQTVARALAGSGFDLLEKASRR